MQQSLALLQAPVLELRALIDQELQNNPVLEEVPVRQLSASEDSRADEEQRAAYDPAEPPPDVKYDSSSESSEPIDEFQAEFQRLIELDEEWREVFAKNNPPLRDPEESAELHDLTIERLKAEPSIMDYLLEQARLSDLTEEELQIAEYIIGNLDDNGYLTISTRDIALALGRPPEEVERVLRIIQGFDPPGIAARSLQECLLLQLERDGKAESLEYRIVREHMDLLARRRIPELARALGVSVAEVENALERLSRLNPRPARQLSSDEPQYVVPELSVVKEDGRWVVQLNNELVPHLRISNTYKDMMARADVPEEVRAFIREKIRAGKFLIRCIHQRQETIRRVAQEIVDRQQDFFEKGPAHLAPMTMAQVAQAVGLHETTVSRAVNGKYIATPWGVFELKQFFTTGVNTANGGLISNKTVKQRICEIIRSEDPHRPLSDEDIVRRLAAEGIHIARRTVAKYRSELGILPSHLRRSYA